MKEDDNIESHHHFLQVFWKTESFTFLQVSLTHITYAPADSPSNIYNSKAVVLQPLKNASWMSKEFCGQLIRQTLVIPSLA